MEIDERVCGFEFRNNDGEYIDLETGYVIGVYRLSQTFVFLDLFGEKLDSLTIRSPWYFKKSFIDFLFSYEWRGCQ